MAFGPRTAILFNLWSEPTALPSPGPGGRAGGLRASRWKRASNIVSLVPLGANLVVDVWHALSTLIPLKVT